MNDLLRIHVLFSASSAEGARLAELVSAHFDGIGMERDGVGQRVPVRFVSAEWMPASGTPRDIDLSMATHNAIVLLHDEYMYEDGVVWDAFVARLHAAMDARGTADVYLPFGSPTGEAPLPSDGGRHLQYAQRRRWSALVSDDSRDQRLLLHLVHGLRIHIRNVLAPSAGTESLFVSHAKSDGDDTAKAIVDYVNDSGNDVPLATFYDAMELAPGEDYQDRFVNEINHGTLLAIISDIYDTRPWCVFELTTAKRASRPVVLADVGRVRTSRTYPYGANLPRVRARVDQPAAVWIEPLLVETLSEGLRCDLFAGQAARALSGSGGVLALPRPPELFDIVERVGGVSTIVYPDPPLGVLEREILDRAIDRFAPGARMVTLSEFA